MITFFVIGLSGGVIFLLLDFLLNVNPLALRLNEPYRPIARQGMRLLPPVIIDIVYGLVMAGIFLLLRPALPGSSGVGAGLAFGLIAWFFRVLMSAISHWVMFDIPVTTHLYSIGAGLVEMIALGLFFGVTFRSFG